MCCTDSSRIRVPCLPGTNMAAMRSGLRMVSLCISASAESISAVLCGPPSHCPRCLRAACACIFISPAKKPASAAAIRSIAVCQSPCMYASPARAAAQRGATQGAFFELASGHPARQESEFAKSRHTKIPSSSTAHRDAAYRNIPLYKSGTIASAWR